MFKCLLVVVLVLTRTSCASDLARKAAEKEAKAEMQLQQLEERQALREQKYGVQLQKAMDSYHEKLAYSRELERIREEPLIARLPVERNVNDTRSKRTRSFNGRVRD